MIARFTNGTATLDLTTGPYSLGTDFLPPALALSYNLPTGGSANRLGGAELVGARADNRSWSFEVRVLGQSLTDIELSARRLAGFVQTAQAFEYQGADLPTPLWGQLGAPLRYELITGEVALGSSYSLPSRVRGILCRVSLTVRPYATGKTQRLTQAKGAVYEDAVGSPDGIPWGLRVLAAVTNKMTNPVFGHSTYDSGWSLAAATAVISKVTDPGFVFPGSTAAVKIEANNTAHYRQTINAGATSNHVFTVIAARPDRKPVSTADGAIYYNSVPLTTTWTALGNGWYRGTASATGVAVATSAGLMVTAGRALILIAMQMEVGWYPTAVFCGDMIGCAWTGTSHASTSTREAGQLRLSFAADTFNLGAWGVHVSWRTPASHAAMPVDPVFFSVSGAPSIAGSFNTAGNNFVLSDATTTIGSAAQTFTAGEVIDLLFTGGPNGLNIYKNGVNIATGATYTLPNVAMTWVNIGSTGGGTQHCDGLLQGLDIYNVEPSAAQAQALYTACSAAQARGQRVGTIPFLWTKDGDMVVDNCDDATRDNWGVAGGIPGDAPAQTVYVVTNSASFSPNDLWLMNRAMKEFVYPSTQWFGDISDSGADASCAGGYYREDNVASTGGDFTVFGFAPARSVLFSTRAHIFARMADTVGGLRVSPYASYGGGYITGPDRAITTSASWRLFYIGEVCIPELPREFYGTSRLLDAGVYLTRAAGTGMVKCDYVVAFDGPVMHVSNSGSWSGALIAREQSIQIDVANGRQNGASLSVRGDYIELEPNVYNHLMILLGGHGELNAITDTLTFNKILVTPRWSLL
jgi:hypothetical protein